MKIYSMSNGLMVYSFFVKPGRNGTIYYDKVLRKTGWQILADNVKIEDMRRYWKKFIGDGFSRTE